MKERDFLRLTAKIDRRYFEEANRRAGNPAQENSEWEALMRKLAHPVLAGVICTMLICGIAIAVVLHRDDTDLIPNPHGTGYAAVDPSGTKIHAALKGTPVQNSIRLPDLSNRFFNINGIFAAYHSLAVTESGWYTVGRPSQQDLVRGVCYTDAATKQTVYLCAKPECLHDGSDYCPATNADYDILQIVWYEGMLYAAAHKNTHNAEKPDALVLLSYQPDGTGMQELATLDDRGKPDFIELIAHRGSLWITGTIEHLVFTGDEALGIDSHEVTMYYGIWHYEIAKSQLTVLATNESYNSQSFSNLQADGDDIYVIKQSHEARYIPRGLFRINAKTGEITLLMQDLKKIIKDAYMVTDGRLLWITKAEEASPATKDIYIMHTLSGDTETVTEVPRGDQYFTDGQYLFIAGNYAKLTICDLDGNILKTQAFPKEKSEQNFQNDTHSFACVNGVLYHVRTEYYAREFFDYISHIETVSLADYLSGDAEFEPAFDTHDIEPDAWKAQIIRIHTGGAISTDE